MEEEEEPEQKPCLKPTLRPISSAPSVSSASGNATPNTPGDESPCGIIIPHENSPDQQQPEEHRPKIGLSLKLGASNSPGQPNSVKRKKLPVDSVFNKFEDEDSDDVPRKRKLVPLDYGEDDKNAAKGTVNTEEKRKHIKSLIEKIPTASLSLTAHPRGGRGQPGAPPSRRDPGPGSPRTSFCRPPCAAPTASGPQTHYTAESSRWNSRRRS